MSAPPIMTASPQPSLLQSPGPAMVSQPISPQQPMSAPPTFSVVEEELAAISNMPIIENDCLEAGTSNKENDELMNILNDLRDMPQTHEDLNQFNYSNNANVSNGVPSSNVGQQQSSPSFILDPQQQNSPSMNLAPSPQQMQQQPQQHPQQQPLQQPSFDQHPIILSPRFNTESSNGVKISDKLSDRNKIPSFPEVNDNQLTETPSRSPIGRSPGVIKRNPSFTAEQNCFTPPQHHSVPTSPSPRGPNGYNSFMSPSPAVVQDIQPSVTATKSQPCEVKSSASSDKVSSDTFDSVQGFSGSGSHPSPSTRALLADSIRQRSSRSSSYESESHVDNEQTSTLITSPSELGEKSLLVPETTPIIPGDPPSKSVSELEQTCNLENPSFDDSIPSSFEFDDTISKPVVSPLHDDTNETVSQTSIHNSIESNGKYFIIF